ncbi:MAG: ATP-dependent sacrificial sulfur transferase LarE [Thermoplasmata archaeon]
MHPVLHSPLGATPEREVISRLRAGGPVLVALSGGVDSSVVAALAHDALGSASVAVTLSGPAVSNAEVERARRVAAAIGIAHVVVPVNPLTREEYRSNPPNRCYFCRSVESEALLRVGRERGVVQYVDGIHLDDLSDDRPGVKAMDAAGFDHPLVRAHWTKADVRTSARDRALPNWDQPSDACLASRVAHGEPLSQELLTRIELGEQWLLERGFRRVRIRTSQGAARVEVDPEEVARLGVEPLASGLRRALEALGFHPVTIDPRGYGAARPLRRGPP